MYMANGRNLRLEPNPTYFPLTGVGVSCGGNVDFKIRVGGNANFSVFRYQHVAIPNAKFRVGGLSQHKEWNIGIYRSFYREVLIMYSVYTPSAQGANYPIHVN